jgi:hypothetical protein
MSTIKSSDEHLTLNADGSSKDIKFQANGVEKASISSAGAFTSTTIDATKLTGALPAISGAALTGVGVAGISSSADATAITIDSSERVGIGTGSPDANLHIKSALTNQPVFKLENTYESGGGTATVTGNAPIIELYANDTGTAQPDSQELGIIEFRGENKDSSAEELFARVVGTNGDANTIGELKFETQQSNTMTTALTIRGHRVVSQSNVHSWVNYNQVGTLSVQDSYNVSSVTDRGTGYASVELAVSHGNASYVVTGIAGNHKRLTQDGAGLYAGSVHVYTNVAGSSSTADESRVYVMTIGD